MTKSVLPPVPTTPLDAKKFPLRAQTAPSPSRDEVRALNPVRAPRQSKRPTERSK